MQNWKKTRNYRKHQSADGSFTHIITVDGVEVEVSAEVFKAYSQGDRKERYLAERDTGRLLSLEQFNEEGITLDHLVDEHIESAEESLLHATLKEEAVAVFLTLTPDERHLIQALVMDDVAERDYAAEIGLSQKGVNKRKHRILEKLKNAVLKP